MVEAISITFHPLLNLSKLASYGFDDPEAIATLLPISCSTSTQQFIILGTIAYQCTTTHCKALKSLMRE